MSNQVTFKAAFTANTLTTYQIHAVRLLLPDGSTACLPFNGETEVDSTFNLAANQHFEIQLIKQGDECTGPVINLDDTFTIKVSSDTDHHFGYNLTKNNERWRIEKAAIYFKEGDTQTNVTVRDDGPGGG